MTPILKVEGLSVHSRDRRGTPQAIVKDISFEIQPGEILGLIGESGSGKSTIGLASLGYVRPGLEIVSGDVWLSGQPILQLSLKERRKLRGLEAAYVPQSAASAFNPALTINSQVIEAQIAHGKSSRNEAIKKAIIAYRQLGLPEENTIGSRYPHEVSGGQLQRLAAAMAFSGGPKLVVFDEPTTALDVTTQIGVMQAFRSTLRESQAAAIYITHDLAVVAQLADRLIVLADGKIVEEGSTTDILTKPRNELTRNLVAASRIDVSQAPVAEKSDSSELLKIRSLTCRYQRRGRPVVRDVSMDVAKAEIVAIVGESGSGKSTLARAVAGLTPQIEGTINWCGNPLPSGVRARTKDSLRRIQLVMQSADTSLNPKQRVRDVLLRPLQLFGTCRREDHDTEVAGLMQRVRLPERLRDRMSGELSGGQKQRLNLARALAAKPDLVLCDEVTSALDVVTRAEIVELIRSIRDSSSTSFLFITHDLITASNLADRIVVMKDGAILEQGSAIEVISRPQKAYTQRLIGSIPLAREGWLDEAIAKFLPDRSQSNVI